MRNLPTVIQAFALFCAATLVVDVAAQTRVAEPDKDPQTRELVQEAQRLAGSKQPAAAIERCDKVIAAFKAHYGISKQKVYCARTPAENLGVLLKAAADKDNAIALSSTWANALFVKAYALEELRRLGEAKTTLQ